MNLILTFRPIRPHFSHAALRLHYGVTPPRHDHIGVTSDLPSREWAHWRRADPKSFTVRYDARRLVWFETYETMVEAIQREKTMKHWYRAWKIALIETTNPHWHPVDPNTGEFIYNHD